MRDWLVVLKDGTRVKVRADYQDSDGEDVFFVDDKGYTVAVFTPHTVAYYFDAASCAVIVDGPPAVVLPNWLSVPSWLKPPFVPTCGTAVPYESPQSGSMATHTGCGICNDPNCKDPSGQH